MIKQFFESPTVGKWKLPYYQRNKYLPESKPTPTTVEEAHIAIQCTRLGLTKAIYLERCAAVMEQSNSCTVVGVGLASGRYLLR